jgi:hypothetical protein
MSRVVNINELTNIVTNVTGVGSDTASLQTRIINIQKMVDYGTKTIFTNNIQKYDTSPIVVADAVSFLNSIQVAGSSTTAAGQNAEVQYNNNGVFGASANLTFDGTSLVNPSLKAPRETLVIYTVSTATLTIQTEAASKFKLVLTTDLSDIRFSGLPAAGIYYTLRLFVIQDSVGFRLLTWPSSIRWGAGGPPTITQIPSAVDIYDLITLDGGATWFGLTIQQGY